MDLQFDYIQSPEKGTEIYPWIGGDIILSNKEDAMNYVTENFASSYSGLESTMRIKLEKNNFFCAKLLYCIVVMKELENGEWAVYDW